MLTALSNGTVTIWATYPFLVQLKFFDCLTKASSPSSPLSDDSDGLPWLVMGIAMVSEGHPLAPTVILSTLTRGDSSIVRCHITEPEFGLFGESCPENPSSLRCNFCSSVNPALTFPCCRSLGAHLASSHPEVVQFPDNYVLSEPQFLRDFEIPLMEVQQSVVVYSASSIPTLIAFGIDDEDRATIAMCSLAPVLASLSPGSDYVDLQWRLISLPEFAYDYTARKLITINRVVEHDTLVILAANAPSIYFVDLQSGTALYSLPYDCDSILDVTYSASTRQLGILVGSNLCVHEIVFPNTAESVVPSVETLTPSALENMKV
jgi:hypothetical protein